MTQKKTNSVELSAEERQLILSCIVLTMKSVDPKETIPTVRQLMPIIDKLENHDSNP
jgi:hypothetical protein